MATDKLKNLLNPSTGGNLGEIISRARQMGELTEILRAALPDDAAEAVVAANIRNDGEMVVICASSAWASRLRYESDGLLRAAANAGLAARKCRIRVSSGQ